MMLRETVGIFGGYSSIGAQHDARASRDIFWKIVAKVFFALCKLRGRRRGARGRREPGLSGLDIGDHPLRQRLPDERIVVVAKLGAIAQAHYPRPVCPL